MENRFSSLFNLTEAQAIEILDGPANDSDEASSRYIAASHLMNFDSEAAIASLMRAATNTDAELDNRIVRRKAVESLGRPKVKAALPLLKDCLIDEDNYLVENAAWAIGEIGTDDSATLETLTQQLEREGQSYRTIIQTLANLNYAPAADRIEPFTRSDSAPIASAANSALYQLRDRKDNDDSALRKVLGYLQSANVNARRGSIQDLIDARFFKAIPNIAQCPVSMVFRLRAIRQLTADGIADAQLSFGQGQSWLERVLRDHPSDLALVHHYDNVPDVPVLISELYGTDFGRCYLATKTLLENYADTAPSALIENYQDEGYNDYGAHYHIMRLFGWLKAQDAYDLLIDALNNKAPQFQKSRVAAAIALGELGKPAAIPALKDTLKVPIWDLQYSAIMALQTLGESPKAIVEATQTDDWLVTAKLNTFSAKSAKGGL